MGVLIAYDFCNLS